MRFSDELDVDAHRANIQMVKNFRIDPHDSIYWWLHNRIKVVFTQRFVLLLSIRLHPDDMEQHGSLVEGAFITKFKIKNQPVMSILAQNDIPIVISSYSKVVEDKHAEHLPSEIAHSLHGVEERKITDLSLSVLGPEKFIQYACHNAVLVRKEDYYPIGITRLGEILSFGIFIQMIDKYTTRWRSKVALDAKIISSGEPGSNYLVVWGIRDTGLRMGKGAKYFPGYQEGMWSCELEQALRSGILPEQVEQFRENLGLREKNGVSNDEFFQIRMTFPY